MRHLFLFWLLVVSCLFAATNCQYGDSTIESNVEGYGDSFMPPNLGESPIVSDCFYGDPDECNDPPPSTCTGCTSNGVCLSGTSYTACGKGGAACIACPSGQSCLNQTCVTRCSSTSQCDDADACTIDQCLNGVCTHSAAPNNTYCGTFNEGTCQSGSCCYGCIDDTGACVGGLFADRCGSHGRLCVACPTSPSNGCGDWFCSVSDGTCHTYSYYVGSPCSSYPNGTCNELGQCCAPGYPCI